MTGGGRPTVAVLRALGLGDLLTVVPALRGLRAGYPGHRTVLLAPSAIGEFAVMERLVDDFVATRPWDVPSAGPVDVAVNLHGRGPQSHLLLRSLTPRVLLAYGSAEAGHTGPPWQDGEPEVARWCRLLAGSGCPCDPSDLRLRPDPPARTTVAVVHPGAASASRRWPSERFAAVTADLVRSGLDVVVTTGPGEDVLAAEVAGGSALVVRPDLTELADLLATAALLVVGDTGVGHLGTACGTPSVRLFGPVDPAIWGPTIDLDRHRVLWHADRIGDPHGATVDAALERITVAEVLAACRDVLVSGTTARALLM